MKSRRKFTKDFKQTAVSRLNSGQSVGEVVAPMPSGITITASSINAGFLRHERSANLRSIMRGYITAGKVSPPQRLPHTRLPQACPTAFQPRTPAGPRPARAPTAEKAD